MIIPKDILNDYRVAQSGADPKFAIRGLSTVENTLGETYVLGDERAVFLYSGKLGRGKDCTALDYSDITEFKIVEQPPFNFLRVETADDILTIKFGSFDLEKLVQIDSLRRSPPAPSTTVQGAGSESTADVDESCGLPKIRLNTDSPIPMVSPDPVASSATVESDPVGVDTVTLSCPELTPMIALTAILHTMIYIDDEAADEEMQNLKLLVDDQEIINQGLLYWRARGTTELVEELGRRLNESQKRCVVANLIEIAMVDGVLKEGEQEFNRYVCSVFNIDESVFKSLFDVLLLKNNISVFMTDFD